jgi:hypothetical protein
MDTSSNDVLKSYSACKDNLYFIGTFDVGVTVYSQQVRALNLAWALIESEILNSEKSACKPKIAIVGGGFAGVTLAAALIKKNVNGSITLLEKRDSLIPLQQGSDSRWIHPKIYDWPSTGSEMASASLPILNWVAGRASDVAVQVMREWKKLTNTLASSQSETLTELEVYCNTHHLQISSSPLKIEWVGEFRPLNPQAPENLDKSPSKGTSRNFDLIILATGFGLERDKTLSYWRNETLAQPYLAQGRATYIVSGQGDGAIIDLLRLRISEFRQDRILAELFSGNDNLIDHLRLLQNEMKGCDAKVFQRLEAMSNSSLDLVIKSLSCRLRRDTQVILHIKVKTVFELFDFEKTKISFQNRILLYLLYKCGGFIPSNADIKVIKDEYSVPEDRIIRRHGTLRDKLLEDILQQSLYQELMQSSKSKFQNAVQHWRGGYFDFKGSNKRLQKANQADRAHWRKEYLPPAIELVANSFCAGIAGFLESLEQKPQDLRVTLHRVITIGNEEILQQSCDYVGNSNAQRVANTAGRTFPVYIGTIGLAYQSQKIVVSDGKISGKELSVEMKKLNLSEASRTMSTRVDSLIAIPFTCPLPTSDENKKVFAILYVDSYTEDVFKVDVILKLNNMIQKFIDEMIKISSKKLERISNYGFAPEEKSNEVLNPEVAGIAYVDIPAPTCERYLTLNFDYADFVMI